MLVIPNLSAKGRVVRGSLALACGLGAIITAAASQPAAIALVVGAAFLAFQSARGWCVLRACGFRTPL